MYKSNYSRPLQRSIQLHLLPAVASSGYLWETGWVQKVPSSFISSSCWQPAGQVCEPRAHPVPGLNVKLVVLWWHLQGLQELLLEWELLIQKQLFGLHLLGLYFLHMHSFAFISIVFFCHFTAQSVDNVRSLCYFLRQILGLTVGNSFVSLATLAIHHLFPAHLWMCWTMQDLSWSLVLAFLKIPLIDDQ